MTKIVKGAAWSEEDDRYLETWRSFLSVQVLAERLQKTQGQIKRRATYLSITKCSDGYTVLSLSQALGCSQARIRRWIACGWLHAKHRKTDRPRDIWYISDTAVLQFLRRHHNEISLAYVNQDWFFDLILGGRHGLGVMIAPDAEEETIS